LYEKAITAWRATKQPHPRCGGHSKLAKMRVVRNLMKASYGRPFFVCSNSWSRVHSGYVRPLVKPECHHRFPCMIRNVKKEGLNKDRKFFCCPNDKEFSCKYFDWVPSRCQFCGTPFK
jgi:hypothetical protein